MIKKDRYYGLSSRIARWKIDNPFENWLSYRADSSEIWKRLYVLYYKLFDNKYYKVGVNIIDKHLTLFKDSWEGVSRHRVVRDMVYSLHRFGISFEDYWSYDMLNKNTSGKDSFVSDKLRYHYCDILNHITILPLMTDKLKCYEAYKEFFKRDVVGCHSMDDIMQFTNFTKKHNRFVFKPLTEHSGHGVAIFDSSQINPKSFMEEHLVKGPFVVEELIEQGKELSDLHKESVNTVRVVTFYDGKETHIIGATLRIGCGNAVMDNAGSGGIFASVDVEKGILQTSATNYQLQQTNIHPDTKVIIPGYQLPKWDEAKQLIGKMAGKVPGTTLISWDIAYSINGWVMVEANDNGDWRLMQINSQKGMKKLLYNLMDCYLKNNRLLFE